MNADRCRCVRSCTQSRATGQLSAGDEAKKALQKPRDDCSQAAVAHESAVVPAVSIVEMVGKSANTTLAVAMPARAMLTSSLVVQPVLTKASVLQPLPNQSMTAMSNQLAQTSELEQRLVLAPSAQIVASWTQEGSMQPSARRYCTRITLLQVHGDACCERGRATEALVFVNWEPQECCWASIIPTATLNSTIGWRPAWAG